MTPARDLHQAAGLRDGAVARHPARRPHLVPRGCRCASTRASTSRSSASTRPTAAPRPRSSSRRSPRCSRIRSSGIEGVEMMTSQSRVGAQPASTCASRCRAVPTRPPPTCATRSRACARKLPEDVDEPVIAKVEADSQPIIYIAVQAGDADAAARPPTTSTATSSRGCRCCPGAADVRIFGERQVSMRINLDRTRLAGYKLTVQDVEDAIRRQNAEIPAGRIESQRARVHRRRRDRRAARPSSSTASSSPTSAATRCASATSATPPSAPSTSA